jgi:hypothetical protein
VVVSQHGERGGSAGVGIATGDARAGVDVAQEPSRPLALVQRSVELVVELAVEADLLFVDEDFLFFLRSAMPEGGSWSTSRVGRSVSVAFVCADCSSSSARSLPVCFHSSEFLGPFGSL